MMPLNPDNSPREFLVVLVAALTMALREPNPVKAFDEADLFVAEVERRYGPLNESPAEEGS
jgi:hypothetical protein